MGKYRIFLLLLLIINIQNKISNICIDSIDNCYKKKKNKEKIKKHYDNINNQKPSIIDFLYQAFYSRFMSTTSSYYQYIDGFKYICKNVYNLYYSYIHKDNIKLNNFRHLFENNEESEKEEIRIKKNKRKNNQNENEKKLRQLIYRDLSSFPYNETNLYDQLQCLTSPNLKAHYKIYFCNNERVSHEYYDKYLNNPSYECEYYINIIKICVCPINYYNCFSEESTSSYCKIKSLTANNNKYDLLKERDKFYYEYSNRTLLPLSEKKFTFNISITCINPSINISNNFYLSTDIDKLAEIEIISTEYDEKDNNTNKIQYSNKDINDKTTKILKYFYKDENFSFFKSFNLILSFTIYEMQWLYPYKNYTLSIPLEQAIKFLNGEPLIFDIDLDELIKSDDVDEIFKDKKYKTFLDNDLYFYEIMVRDKDNDQIIFYSYQGEIDRKN